MHEVRIRLFEHNNQAEIYITLYNKGIKFIDLSSETGKLEMHIKQPWHVYRDVVTNELVVQQWCENE